MSPVHPVAGRRPSAAGRSASSRPVVRLSSLRDVGTTTTLLQSDDGLVRRTLLPGGLRVITEEMPGVRSASVGVWVGAGSVDEAPSQHGCSHFLEHLLFKGTRQRSAMDISVEMDAVGGEFNAFTAKEYTCFHARVLAEDLPVGVDVLGDMLTSATLAAADVEAERDVILDEIAMHDDDPDEVVHNLFAQQAWGSTRLGRQISGTAESVGALTPAQVRRFYRRHYRAANMVVAVAGGVQHDAVVGLVHEGFARAGFLDRDDLPVVPVPSDRARRVRPGTVRAARPFEQVNLVLGFGGLTRTDDRRYVLGVLNAALGGGTSSRLFQEVRERRGLAYSVFSFAEHHADAGLVGVSAGCLPDRVEAVLKTVRTELAKVADSGVTEEELARGVRQLRGGTVLGLEDSSSRMSRLGKAELVYDELLSIDDILARLDAVTVDDVRRLAAEVFSQPEILALVGPAR